MPNPNYECFQLDWNGILIELKYCPDYCQSFKKIYGHPMAHMTIQTIDPAGAALPITDTGFLSQYITETQIPPASEIVDTVMDALEVAKNDPAWRRTQEAARQYSLF